MSSKVKSSALTSGGAALVPTQRFPEFQDSDGWREVSLQKLARPVTDRATIGDADNVLSLSGEHGLVLQSDYFGKKIAGDSTDRYLKIRKDDFVYNDRTTKASSFGTIKRLSKYSFGIVSPIYKCFRFQPSENAAFWEWYFESGRHDPALRGLVNEGARAGRFNISVTQFLSTTVWRPDEAEQQKIADCLDSVDTLIAAQERKVEALTAHKQGLMQKLFPQEGETQPRLRFPEFKGAGEWLVKDIGQIAEVSASGDLDTSTFAPEKTESHPYPVYANGVESEGLYGFSSEAKYKAGSITITARGTLGRAFYRKTDFVGIGRLVVVSSLNGEVDSRFLRECWDHLAVIPAEVTSIPQLTAVTVRRTPLPFPSLFEQQRIADCLTSLDDLIAAETHKLDTLKTHKKGLMQQLFPQVGGDDA